MRELTEDAALVGVRKQLREGVGVVDVPGGPEVSRAPKGLLPHWPLHVAE